MLLVIEEMPFHSEGCSSLFFPYLELLTLMHVLDHYSDSTNTGRVNSLWHTREFRTRVLWTISSLVFCAYIGELVFEDMQYSVSVHTTSSFAPPCILYRGFIL